MSEWMEIRTVEGVLDEWNNGGGGGGVVAELGREKWVEREGGGRRWGRSEGGKGDYGVRWRGSAFFFFWKISRGIIREGERREGLSFACLGAGKTPSCIQRSAGTLYNKATMSLGLTFRVSGTLPPPGPTHRRGRGLPWPVASCSGTRTYHGQTRYTATCPLAPPLRPSRLG